MARVAGSRSNDPEFKPESCGAPIVSMTSSHNSRPLPLQQTSGLRGPSTWMVKCLCRTLKRCGVLPNKEWNSPSAYARVFICYTHIVRSRGHESSQYARVRAGFNRLHLDRDLCTDDWRMFYGSSSEASFRHWIRGKFSNRRQVLLLPTAMSPKELLIEKTCGWPTLYNLACKIIQQY